MIIKVGDEFLEFEADVEVERKVKLFEEISSNSGDFSYQFQIPATNGNKLKLGIQDINQPDKTIYTKVQATLYSNSGNPLYYGYIKVESEEDDFINASFFSGNSNWISLLKPRLKDIYLGNFDTTLAETLSAPNVTDVQKGIYFPFIDAGVLSARIGAVMTYSDFRPFIYVKSVVQAIFNQAGIKVTGDILLDPVYDKMIVSSNVNEWFQEFIDARTCFVGKDSDQAVVGLALTIVTFPDDTFPEFIGTNNSWSTSTNRFTADVGMSVRLELFLATDVLVSSSFLYRNGVDITNDYNYTLRTIGTEFTIEFKEIPLAAGDYLEIKVTPLSSGNVLSTTTLRITPTKFDKVYANSVLPDWDSSEFLDNIFSFFNTVIEFDGVTNTIDINLFKNVKKKEVQDLSEYYSRTIGKEYFSFIEDYGRKDRFRYIQIDLDSVTDYNRKNVNAWGESSIELGNEYLNSEETIVDSAFSNAGSYDNVPFGVTLSFCSLIELVEFGETATVASVSNSGGNARFACTGDHGFSVGNIVRLSSFDSYSGDGVISSIPSSSTFEIQDLAYAASETGSAVIMDYTFPDSDTYILLAIPNLATTDAGMASYKIHNGTTASTYTKMNFGFFVKKRVNQALDNIKVNLSFGDITTPRYDQSQNLKDRYFSEFEAILNDPVKVVAEMHIPEAVFRGLSFSRPVRIASIDVNSQFYMNRITGYKEQSKPCEFELIKIS